MVADSLMEKVELFPCEFVSLDQLLSNLHLLMDRRPNLERVRSNMVLLLRDVEARLRRRNYQHPGGTNAD